MIYLYLTLSGDYKKGQTIAAMGAKWKVQKITRQGTLSRVMLVRRALPKFKEKKNER